MRDGVIRDPEARERRAASRPPGPASAARGPGRVNLIGDHTDYNGGLAMPVAIDLGTDVVFTPTTARTVTLYSTAFDAPAVIPLDIEPDADMLPEWEPAWARAPAALVALCRPDVGGVGRITSSLPIGAGLSSSAALCVALAHVFGDPGPVRSAAAMCQQVETLAGVPIGPMDPLVCTGAIAGHAMLIDFAGPSFTHVPVPGDAEIVVVDSGVHRALRRTPYGARVAECEAAAVTIGPLGAATEADVEGIRDRLLQRRVRHVVTECARVRRFAEALRDDDLAGAGALMAESHASLRDDFEVSIDPLDRLVDRLSAIPGVYGARLTGAGFGGCVVALADPGAVHLPAIPARSWRVVPSDGAACARPSGGREVPA